MRKQARKLWFGDWQGSQESDTVVFLTDDEDDGGPHRRLGRGPVVALLAAVLLLALALSNNGSDKWLASVPSAVPPVPIPQAQIPQAPQGVPPQGFGGGGDLTGADAARAARAALSKFPGDIERVTPGPGGGGYVVHVFQDGYEIHVLVGPDFHVQGSDAPRGPGTGGQGSSQ